MLTQQLRELERDNIVSREVYQQVPPKVEYSLSDYGKSLTKVLDILCDWGEAHVEHLMQNGEKVVLRCE
ncbi:HxlR family transcriptional regulator [Listeria aquatica FSL S10-1188]|uniref:HxlR family transcriptional regulator n=2 Tax=Listeria aquatica TaxID=1494960 RepID=W7B1T0_9LIST|nr:HxlR family transcriptional regulator [Listeria aquatica FSL S10-1188]